MLPPPFGFWGVGAWVLVAYLLWPVALGHWASLGILSLSGWAALQTVLPSFGQPLWRESFKGLVELPATLSPQPLLSLATLPYLWVGGLAALWFLCRPTPADYLKRVSRRLAIAGVIMSTIAAVCLLTQTRYFAFPDLEYFTYFPNRNQSATLYAIFATLGLGLYILEQRRTWKKVGLLCLVVSVCAIALSPSRGGWISLGVGFISLLATTRGRYLWLTLAICAGAAVILAGPVALDTAHKGLGVSSTDIRATFYQNGLTMVAQNPLGFGLGNIGYIFPHYQSTTPFDQTAVHPESDWLWLAGELGLPAVILLAALLLSLHWDADQRRTRMAKAILWSIFIGSLIDVPGHRYGIWMIVLTLAGGLLVLPAGKKPLLPPYLFTVFALGVMGLGLIPVSMYSRLQERFNASLETGSLYWARQTYGPLDKQIPLEFSHKQRMGLAELRWEGSPDYATRLFKETLLAQPCYPKLAHDLGFDIRPFNPTQTISFWRECLRRTEPTDRARVLNEFLRLSSADQIRPLMSLLGSDPTLWATYLGYDRTPTAFAAAAQTINLATLPKADKLLLPWATTYASAPDALAYLQKNNALPLLQATCLATVGHAKEAVALAFQASPPTPFKDNHPKLTNEELHLQIKLLPEYSARYKETLASRALSAADTQTYTEIIRELARKPKQNPHAAWLYAKLLAEQNNYLESWRVIYSTFSDDSR